jgi:hypothetical protein
LTGGVRISGLDGALERCHRDGLHGGGKRQGLLREADHAARPHGYLSFFENPEMTYRWNEWQTGS